MLPKISIVTINLDNARFLEETIQSVISQNYPNLEYIIIDGGSTDGSIEVIKKYENRLAYWISEKDEGYGFALQKGFSKSTGEIMAWLNSDDVYYPGCLFTVAEIFTQHPPVKWLTGFPSWLCEKGFRLGEMPAAMNSLWAKRYDLYLKYSRWSQVRYLGGDYRSIQQESTFWKRELWEKAGNRINTGLKLAIDTELWCRFFRHERLYTTPCLLAGFRWSGGKQLTKIKRVEYDRECRKVISQEFKSLGAFQAMALQFRFCASWLFKPAYYFNLPLGSWYEKISGIPPLVENINTTPSLRGRENIWKQRM